MKSLVVLYLELLIRGHDIPTIQQIYASNWSKFVTLRIKDK